MLTCCNLLSGSFAVLMATQGQFYIAFLFIIIGALFDFSDGFVARLLGIASPIGKELDSLADVVTFGLAPSMMLFRWLFGAIGWWALLAFLMVAFSAFRLAKFNLDERQTTSFIGLATPPNALFWASISCMPAAILQHKIVAILLLCLSGVSCYLLVSEIPFFSFKSHHAKKQNLVFGIGCLLICMLCTFFAIHYHKLSYALFIGAACVLWYVLFNFIINCKNK